MAIDPAGCRQKNSRAAWQCCNAAPEQKSEETGGYPRAALQKRPKSSVQAHSETGVQTYSLLLKIQQRWAERNVSSPGQNIYQPYLRMAADYYYYYYYYY